MTKKHFIKIASILNNDYQRLKTTEEFYNFNLLVKDFADYFQEINNRFDTEKFIDVIYDD